MYICSGCSGPHGPCALQHVVQACPSAVACAQHILAVLVTEVTNNRVRSPIVPLSGCRGVRGVNAASSVTLAYEPGPGSAGAVVFVMVKHVEYRWDFKVYNFSYYR